MIALDTNFLLLFLSPLARAPSDPTTNQPVDFAHERVTKLIEALEAKGEKLLIPTPVLSEVLVHAGAALEQYVRILHGRAVFRVASFDSKAAVELALSIKRAKDGGDKRDGVDAIWAKVKFDRQIIAIAKVEGATAIYSDDPDIMKLAPLSGIKVFRLLDCPYPQPPASLPQETKDRSHGQTSLL